MNPLPPTAAHTAFGAAGNTADFLSCNCTLLGPVELLINQHNLQSSPQGLFLIHSLPSQCLRWGLLSTQGQDLALGLAKLHGVLMGSPLKPVQALLDGIPFLQHAHHTTQLGGIGKVAEGTLNPTLHVPNKGAKQYKLN